MVNGKMLITKATTLFALCEELELAGPIATAHNGSFVPASSRTSTQLAEGDKIEIVSPRQGG